MTASSNGAGGELWIIIRNWDRFQHYNDRRPVWIKLYTELLGDPDYMRLTPSDRGILSGLWLMYAESSSAIPLDTAWISRKLSARVNLRTLERLNHAGYIDFSASKPLAPRYQSASPPAQRVETETETETEKSQSATASQAVARPPEPLEPIGATVRDALAGSELPQEPDPSSEEENPWWA